MTERFTAWLVILERRDWALTQFALLALAAVAVWEFIRLAPPTWQDRLRAGYLILGLGVFYALVLIA